MKKQKSLIMMLGIVFCNFIMINVNATGAECNPVFDKNSVLGGYIVLALTVMRWGAIVALIILGSVDFGKAMLGGSDEAMKKATRTFINRLIIAIAIFLVPSILDLLLSLIGTSTCNY